MFQTHSNFAYGTISTAPDPQASGTTVVMGTTTFAQFPNPGTATTYNAVIWPSGTIPLASNAEIVTVVAKGAEGTVNITREQEGSSARTIAVGDQIAMAVTKRTLTDVERLANAPEGFLINGKIVPSVASNNLTVALKGLDGNDPSATNPVYVRIGDTVRSITAALSVVANAGTSYLALGAAELATKEADLFVYLGWNATGGNIIMAFSRVPYACKIDDFVISATDAKGWVATGTASYSNTDAVVNIGRFAATLSAGAGYTWTVPTFTATNLIQRPIFETRTLTFVSVVVGYTGAVTGSYTYQISGMNMRIFMQGTGTSNATGLTCTLPLGTIDTAGTVKGFIYGVDNGTAVAAAMSTVGASTRIDLYTTTALGGWTNSGTKTFHIYHTFAIA